MASPAAREKVRRAVIAAIHARAKQAFALSQTKVPVITGKLKRSGREENLETGAGIVYHASYSSYVEHGLKGGMQEVKGYYRKDGSYVRSFSRYMPPRKGKFYLGSSVKESFNGLDTELTSQLSSQGFRIVKGN